MGLVLNYQDGDPYVFKESPGAGYACDGSNLTITGSPVNGATSFAPPDWYDATTHEITQSGIYAVVSEVVGIDAPTTSNLWGALFGETPPIGQAPRAISLDALNSPAIVRVGSRIGFAETLVLSPEQVPVPMSLTFATPTDATAKIQLFYWIYQVATYEGTPAPSVVRRGSGAAGALYRGQ
jgi:hypothetical protein